jgi:hypothetical protein
VTRSGSSRPGISFGDRRKLNPAAGGPASGFFPASWPMPLSRFLGDTTFGPEEIAVLVAAYEAAMRELDLTGPTAPGAATLASAVFRLRSRANAIRADSASALLRRSRACHRMRPRRYRPHFQTRCAASAESRRQVASRRPRRPRSDVRFGASTAPSQSVQSEPMQFQPRLPS